MGSWLDAIADSHEDLNSDPVKAGRPAMTSNPKAKGVGIERFWGAYWPVSLTKLVSSRFRENP